MRLLISAYACRPGMGSEPAVGWSWVSELSKRHELFILTNYTNQPYINKYLENAPEELKKINFIYVRPKKVFTFWYKEWSRGERLYYHLWQHTALKIARKLHEKEHFDLVQHLTYVTCIMPTYMYKLGIPFVYGPISGGEKIPKVIGYPMNPKEHLTEFVRTVTQFIPKLSINTHRAFKHASKIITVTEDTKELVPHKYRDKVVVMQAIGLKDEHFIPAPNFYKSNSHVVKVLMAGRMLYWKGFELGIEAFKLACSKATNMELTILGDGNQHYAKKLRLLAGSFNDRQIRFVKQVDYNEMRDFYEQFDILLNCSLRDSGCLVVMEGMGRGLPVICVDTGGPKVNTTRECAYKIAPQPFSSMKEQIAEALIELSENACKREQMSLAAYKHAQNKFKNSMKIQTFEKLYREVVEGK